MKRYRMQKRSAKKPRFSGVVHLRRTQKSGRDWTPEQLCAITRKGGGILVAAAAGSGKTAVLVERVIRRITNPIEPIPADRFLVVTFTNAAAAEMRARIAARLRELIAAEPENPRLERQLLLLSKARICTMDAFFGAMVRENFERLGVSPNLRVADETELATLRAGAMDAVLERHFAEPDADFLAAADYFGETGDERLAKEVFTLYEKTRSLPRPDEWLREQESRYADASDPAATAWGQGLLTRASQALQNGARIAEKIAALLDWDEGLQKGYGTAIGADRELLCAGSRLAVQRDWDGLYAFLNAASFGPIGRAPKNSDPALKARVTGMRDLCKAALQEARACLPSDSAGFRDDLALLAPVVRGVFQLVRDFGTEFSAAKAEQNAADFSDFAFLTLRLTTAEDGQPTPFARELSMQFEEILLDEYQDTNRLQDQIFRSVSRAGTNQFLVGDLKQSIYRFRSADPAIFAEKQELFAEDGQSFPALLRLSKNFRSRAGVLSGVNSVFSQVMSREVGGVSYDSGEQVNPGASYPDRQEPAVRVSLIDLKDSGSEDSRIVTEARQTAHMIAAMLRQKYPVTEKGALRPCRGGDFAILLRSPRNTDSIFFDALRLEGVSAAVGSAEGYFTSREVSVMLSLLQVLDNPLQDIPLAALLLSPMGNFSCDSLAALRLSCPEEPLYNALNAQAREGEPHAAELLALLSALREKAAVKRVRALIQYIYDTTDFVEVISGMSASGEREANLKLLLKYAGDYEKLGSSELSGFVAYIRRLMEDGRDFEVVSPLAEEANAVHILSAHKSKGLEFPIVILANCAKRFNLTDLTGDSCLNPGGYGLRVVARETAQKYETVPFAAVRLLEQAETVSEELRLLYVAMTRARETLVLNLTEQNLGGKLVKISATLDGTEALEPYAAGQMRSWSDWLLAALVRHPAFADIRAQFGLDLSVRPEEFPLELGWVELDADPAAEPDEAAPEADPALEARIAAAAHWHYPEEARTKIPAKLAVTDVVRREEELAGHIFLPAPSFTREAGFSPAQKGSIFHRALQFADYRAGREDPPAELSRLIEAGFLSRAEADSISPEKFAAFFRSPLMDRILAADCVRREYRFFDAIPAREAGYESDASILIQGIADCVLEEDGAGVILDFKTDAASPETLKARYSSQLRLYRRALTPLFPKGIKECVLYSAYHNLAVSI